MFAFHVQIINNLNLLSKKIESQWISFNVTLRKFKLASR